SADSPAVIDEHRHIADLVLVRTRHHAREHVEDDQRYGLLELFPNASDQRDRVTGTVTEIGHIGDQVKWQAMAWPVVLAKGREPLTPLGRPEPGLRPPCDMIVDYLDFAFTVSKLTLTGSGAWRGH